jgi:hypothetical protein
MGRIADAETVIAESRVSVLVDRNINVAVVEIIVRDIPVRLIESILASALTKDLLASGKQFTNPMPCDRT